VELAAASQAEDRKNRSYKSYLTPAAFQFFVPFTLECSGRFGKSASKFIDIVSGLAKRDLCLNEDIKWARKRFLGSVSGVVCSTNAEVIMAGRRRGDSRLF
jgi:hypothetical protein